MTGKMKLAGALLTLAIGSGAGAQGVALDAQAPDFTLSDNGGVEHTLSQYRGSVVVLEWINFDCPFVKKFYAPGVMPKLQKQYREQGVVWLSINSSAPGKQGHFAGKDLDKRIKSEKHAATAYLLDTDGTVGKLYGARTTPHMYLIDDEGVLRYAGAIDDSPTTDSKDIEGAVNYVVQALGEIAGGDEVSVKTTRPYGCSVKY